MCVCVCVCVRVRGQWWPGEAAEYSLHDKSPAGHSHSSECQEAVDLDLRSCSSSPPSVPQCLITAVFAYRVCVCVCMCMC